jgi:outer membrane protein assembly factor BamB
MFARLVLLMTFAATSFAAENWPRWRGPRDNGAAAPGSYPSVWSDTTNLLWKVALPGKGSSTPIVWERRIYLTAPLDGNDAVLAFDWNGKSLWQTKLGPERPGKHKAGSGCNPSVATDGNGLFAYFKSGTLAALGMDGKLRWKTNLIAEYGPDKLFWDTGSSPVLTERDVVVPMMRAGDSYLAAFDKATGKLHWKTARDYKVAFEADHGYTTPIVTQFQGAEALLVWGAEHLTIHAAADGEVLWSRDDFNPEKKANWPPVASPVIANDIVVVPYGRGMRCHGIKLGGQRLWLREDTGSFSPSPAVWKDCACVVNDKSRVDGLDIATGKTLWSVALPKGPGIFFSSPTLADDKLYVARENGSIYVLRLTDAPAVIAQNDLGERVSASPVPVEGRLLLRGEKHLYCIGER